MDRCKNGAKNPGHSGDEREVAVCVGFDCKSYYSYKPIIFGGGEEPLKECNDICNGGFQGKPVAPLCECRQETVNFVPQRYLKYCLKYSKTDHACFI